MLVTPRRKTVGEIYPGVTLGDFALNTPGLEAHRSIAPNFLRWEDSHARSVESQRRADVRPHQGQRGGPRRLRGSRGGDRRANGEQAAPRRGTDEEPYEQGYRQPEPGPRRSQ